MPLNRRQFLGLGLSTISTLSVKSGYAQPLLNVLNQPKLLSCRKSDKGKYFLSLCDMSGKLLMDILLPARGHGICLSPDKKTIAVFARRPGNFVWLIDLPSQQVTHKILPKAGRHFYGHGIFTADGNKLLCSENDYETGQGKIGIYEVKLNFKRSGEYASYGIGPHEIKLLNDNQTLVIANGGIRTHPDLPRVKMNLDTMQPNLSFVNLQNGKLINTFELAVKNHQLSIRHIDVAADNSVVIAMQYQGKKGHKPALIALKQANSQTLKLLTAPKNIQKKMRNYCGSITFSHDSSRFAVSSPRGGMVSYWRATGEYLGIHKQLDVCGISHSKFNNKTFFASDGRGYLFEIDNNLIKKHAALLSKSQWDNHLLLV